jgi:hypothetical protein
VPRTARIKDLTSSKSPFASDFPHEIADGDWRFILFFDFAQNIVAIRIDRKENKPLRR